MNYEDRKLIATQHCNKLIAEFMGVKPKSVLGHGKVYNDYSKSWDWLMPVISKCFKTGDDTHQWDNIMDTMFTCDIKIVYAQIVEFIKENERLNMEYESFNDAPYGQEDE